MPNPTESRIAEITSRMFALPRDQDAAFFELGEAITDGLTRCRDEGVPQGLLVALLQGHILQETERMLRPCTP